MEFLNFLHEDPVIAWLMLLGLLVTVVPAAWVLWCRLSGHRPVKAAKQPVRATKSTHFGNQTELMLVLIGLVLLLALFGWIRGTFWG